MKFSIRVLILFSLMFSGLFAADAALVLARQSSDNWPAMPDSRVGAFAGISGKQLIVLGGANPGKSLPNGTLVLGIGSWLKPEEAKPTWKTLPGAAELAYGASAQYGDAFICVGGLGVEGPSASVRKVMFSEGTVVSSPLPSLPVALVGCGAAVVNDRLYVVGGLRSLGTAAEPEKTLWALELKEPGASWQRLEDFPASGRVMPIVYAQYDVVHVVGGRELSKERAGRYVATNHTYVYRPMPLDGTTARGWIRQADCPVPMAAGAGVGLGQGHSLVLGGDQRSSVENPLSVAVPEKEQSVWLFHTLTDVWADTGLKLRIAFPVALRHPVAITREVMVVGGLGDVATRKIVAVRNVKNLGVADYLVMAFYFSCLAGLGFLVSRKQKTSAEYSLGNRSVKWWAAGISMFATGASAISFMAIPALAFATNLFQLFPTVIMIAGFFVQAFLVFPLLRKLEITSTYEYLDKRFNRSLCLIASVQCILFQTFGRAAVVLALPSIAISAVTGMNVFLSVIFMGLLTTAYTAFGGFKAVIWTDVFQGILKFCAPVMMILVCWYSLPGKTAEFVAVGKQYAKFDLALVTWDLTVPAMWVMLVATFLQCTVSLAGDQPTIQRVFSSPPKEVRKIAFVYVVCGILISTVVNILGISIFAYFRAHPQQLDAGAPNDQIVPMFAVQALPTGVAGMVIAAIFASAMSTVASSMNSSATIFTQDFFKRWYPLASDATILRVLRLTSFSVGLVGTCMALVLVSQDIKSMMVVWNQIVALLGGGIVGVYSLGMLTKRTHGAGAVAGALTSVLFTLYVKNFTHWHWATYTPAAIISCMVAGYLFSFVLPGKKRDLRGLTVFTV